VDCQVRDRRGWRDPDDRGARCIKPEGEKQTRVGAAMENLAGRIPT